MGTGEKHHKSVGFRNVIRVFFLVKVPVDVPNAPNVRDSNVPVDVANVHNVPSITSLL